MNTRFENFVNTTPMTAYLLGYLWADGHLYDYGRNRRITISVVENDGIYLLPLFEKTGIWRTYRHERKTCGPNSKPQLQIYIQDKQLFEWLKDCGYKKKSGKSPNLILNHIPENIHHYFWRGYIDGDGCFYVRPNGKSPEFSISSTYNQDWASAKLLCKYLGIHYTIRKRIHKLGRGSCFIILRRNDIRKLGQYLYKDFDGIIGLTRKYDKYQKINSYNTKPGRKSLVIK
jgi:hypothetical protein